MPLQSVSEFEAVLGQVVIKIDKRLYERGEDPKLKDAKRGLEDIVAVARDTPRLKAMRPRLAEISEIIRVEPDEASLADAWDALDLIDFGL